MAALGGRVVVFGGNGLLGSTICRAAALRGFDVTSVSRRGNAPPSAAPWAREVEWVKVSVRECVQH